LNPARGDAPGGAPRGVFRSLLPFHQTRCVFPKVPPLVETSSNRPHGAGGGIFHLRGPAKNIESPIILPWWGGVFPPPRVGTPKTSGNPPPVRGSDAWGARPPRPPGPPPNRFPLGPPMGGAIGCPPTHQWVGWIGVPPGAAPPPLPLFGGLAPCTPLRVRGPRGPGGPPHPGV